MAIDINYKGNNIASLNGIKTAVIECAGKKMTDDLTIIVTEEGGSECSGNHIIDVEEMQEVGVEGAVYWANTFTDVFLQKNGDKILFSQLAKMENVKVYLGDFLTDSGSDGLNRPDGYDVYLYYLPIKVEELEALYSTPNIFMGADDGGYSPLSQQYDIPFQGEITDTSQATEDGYYAYMSIVFYQYTNGEFKELTTENIDTMALYKVGDSYYRYVDGAFTDVVIVEEDGERYSLLALYSALLGITPELYTIKTRPTTEEELANIVVSDLGAGVMALYYIEDEADVCIYMDSAWDSLGANGVISDASEATAAGMYILAGAYWAKYISPSGSITITENSIVDVTDKKSVIVDIPQPSGTLTITENGTHDVTEYGSAYVNVPQPSGNIKIATNGTHDVTKYASAEVSIPTTYVVQSVADLPVDAPIGSIAYVLGGE